ncbi:hypothetical protein [Ornatilinea apprima]|uniref:hypothetical protein n=1 Tax=Ornatilinea apprima TaxID=1134406 RepID=UPI0009466DC5|nr:hypothetical protein [Ornatilinea apprima]
MSSDKTSWKERMVRGLFGRQIEQAAARQAAKWQAQFSVEDDSTFALGGQWAGSGSLERAPAERERILSESLEAWRVNPLARRIVELTTQYVVGGGLAVSAKDAAAQQFLKAFWRSRLNRMETRCMEWCDELARSGNLFVLLSTDAAGMSYARAVPAASIQRIETRSNDSEQAVAFYPYPGLEQPDPRPWKAYDPQQDAPLAGGGFESVMLHYAVNRPVGAVWGESDLAPLLRWLARYANWLEDRARLNRYRNAFLYVVKARFASEAERIARQQQLNAQPPRPGSILVTGESESWEVLSPKLDANEANSDGLALKKMAAAGAGVPMHFLAEPEGSTRTTAEAAGGPTYRRFEQRQRFFLWVIEDVLRAALRRRAMLDRALDAEAEMEVRGADISARDNAALGLAAANINTVLAELRDRGLIDDGEYLRLVYRFAGEAVDAQSLLERARRAAPPRKPQVDRRRPPRQVLKPAEKLE